MMMEKPPTFSQWLWGGVRKGFGGDTLCRIKSDGNDAAGGRQIERLSFVLPSLINHPGECACAHVGSEKDTSMPA